MFELVSHNPAELVANAIFYQIFSSVIHPWVSSSPPHPRWATTARLLYCDTSLAGMVSVLESHECDVEGDPTARRRVQEQTLLEKAQW